LARRSHKIDEAGAAFTLALGLAALVLLSAAVWIYFIIGPSVKEKAAAVAAPQQQDGQVS